MTHINKNAKGRFKILIAILDAAIADCDMVQDVDQKAVNNWKDLRDQFQSFMDDGVSLMLTGQDLDVLAILVDITQKVLIEFIEQMINHGQIFYTTRDN